MKNSNLNPRENSNLDRDLNLQVRMFLLDVNIWSHETIMLKMAHDVKDLQREKMWKTIRNFNILLHILKFLLLNNGNECCYRV